MRLSTSSNSGGGLIEDQGRTAVHDAFQLNELRERMTNKESQHFDILVQLHGHSMRSGLDPETALTEKDLLAIEEYAGSTKQYNAKKHRHAAASGALNGQAGSCDTNKNSGASEDARMVRDNLSDEMLVQAYLLAMSHAAAIGTTERELYRQIVWHMIFNPQARNSTFRGLRIAQNLLKAGRWGAPYSLRPDFAAPLPRNLPRGGVH